MKILFKIIRKLIIKDININREIRKMMKYRVLLENNKEKILRRKFYSFLVNYYHNKIFIKYNCDIHIDAKIKNVNFHHPIGIVIENGTEINDNVVVLQNVTFGSLDFEKRGTIKYGRVYKQIIGKNTVICAGAKILGDVTIGENCIVGANAVVTKDVPDGATVVGYNKIVLK